MDPNEERRPAPQASAGDPGVIMDAVAYAAIALLRSRDVGAELPAVLRMLGESIGVSRVYVYQNFISDGQLADIQLFAWTAPGIGAAADEDSNPYAPVYERYVRTLGIGDIIAELAADAPEGEQTWLKSDGTLSYALVPIFVGDGWWGYIGFDDCWSERRWTKPELGALRVAAEAIGAAFERQERDSSLIEIERRYRTFIEQAPDIIVYADHPDEDDNTTYVSPQVEDILGVTPERWMEAEGGTLWQDMLHPDDRERVKRQYEAYLDGGPDLDDYRMVREDGRVVWIRDRAKLVPDAEGRMVEWGVFMDITDRRGVEEQLRETEGLHRTLIEQLPAVVYTEDADGRILYASPRSYDILGTPPEQWLENPGLWEQMLVPEDRDEALARASQHRDLKTPYRDEYRLCKPDGTIVWIRDEAVAVFDRKGRLDRWQGLMTDITEDKRAREIAEQTETEFRTLVENSPALIYIDTPDGLNLPQYVSPQVEEMLGYTQDEWMANPNIWAELLHPDDRAQQLGVVAEADATGKPYETEYRMITRDGRTIWVHEAAELTRSEAGDALHWQGVIVNITAQKAAEERLREAEERFRILLDSGSAITTIVSADEEVLHVSPQIEDVYGYPPEEFIRNVGLWEAVLHPGDRERIMNLDRLTDETGEPLVADYRIITASGEAKWIHEESNFVDGVGDSGGYWLGIQLDVSAAKRAEELERTLAVERATNEKLRELDQLKDQFLAGVSHDLRTPLSSILGFALTLDQNFDDLSPEQQRDFLERITVNAQKLNELVTDLLDMHRTNQGVLVLKTLPVDIGALVAEVVDQADYLTNPVEVETEPVSIQADATKVKRIVENLLTNTARHTPPGTQVWVRVSAQPGGALISVEDAGPGIPADEKTRLFEEFARGADGPRESWSPGLGVGLSLVARFAELHGGRAWVEDRPGGGSAFRVSLPKDQAAH